MLNRSFAALPYYTEITPDEMTAATDGLAYLLDERLLLLARDAGSGEAVAFDLVVPTSPFPCSASAGGAAAPPTQLPLTRARYRREAILVIQGTDPGRQGRGILSLLSRQLHANLAEGGYRRLRRPRGPRQHRLGPPVRALRRYAAGRLHLLLPEDRMSAADIAAMLRIASRSPSAHNTQPWAPRIVGPDTVEVSVVPARTLPAGDPSFRDLVLALGAWCESLAVAAAADGRSIDVEPPMR